MNALKPPVLLPSAHCVEQEAEMVVGGETISEPVTNPVMDTGSDYIAHSLWKPLIETISNIYSPLLHR